MNAQGIFGQYILFFSSTLLATAGIPAAHAQTVAQQLTGKLMQEPAVATTNASAPPARPVSAGASAAAGMAATAPVQAAETMASAEPEARIRIGDVTRTLLQAQVDGRVAGPRLPMLGVTADLSWQRYLDSFKYPLPVFFENKVSKSASN